MTHTLQAVAEQLGVSVRTVQEWVSRGELRAISVSRSRSSRKPRLRILDHDLRAFLESRSVGPDPPKTRRRKPLPLVKEYV